MKILNSRFLFLLVNVNQFFQQQKNYVRLLNQFSRKNRKTFSSLPQKVYSLPFTQEKLPANDANNPFFPFRLFCIPILSFQVWWHEGNELQPCKFLFISFHSFFLFHENPIFPLVLFLIMFSSLVYIIHVYACIKTLTIILTSLYKPV